jgi:hypothetical protein
VHPVVDDCFQACISIPRISALGPNSRRLSPVLCSLVAGFQIRGVKELAAIGESLPHVAVRHLDFAFATLWPRVLLQVPNLSSATRGRAQGNGLADS